MFSALSVQTPFRVGNQGSYSGFPLMSTVLPCEQITQKRHSGREKKS
jgi:hypothetical protein